MSFFDYLFSILDRNNVIQHGSRNFPIVKADIKEEIVPCINPDGSLSEMIVCCDVETGERVACSCPSCGHGSLSPPGKGWLGFLKSNGMAPPYYADLSKKANDVFSKGYHFGVYKFDLKTKSQAGVEFTSGITSTHESGKVLGSLSSKYSMKDYGLSFTEKWNTDNTLGTDITIQDKIAQGLKLTLETTFAPQSGKKTGKLKTSFASEVLAINSTVDLNLAGPVVDVAAVLGHQGWLAGFNSTFDSQKSQFIKNNLSFGYQSADFNLHTNFDNGKDFGGTIYQKVSEKIDVGVSMKWTAGDDEQTLFGVGAKVGLDADASLHCKVNNKALFGLGYQQRLRPGVILTLSAAIDGQNFNGGGHKFGLALDLEPNAGGA